MTGHDAASGPTGAFGVTDPTQPAISVSDVSKSYGEREVLHDVTLQVQAGEAVALLGPNGAGNSALMAQARRHSWRRCSGFAHPAAAR